MAVKFSLNKNIPVVVDEDFIDHCLRISKEIEIINRKEIAIKCSITEEEYDYVLSGNKIDTDSDNYKELYSAKSALQYSNNESSAHFRDGTIVESKTLEEVIDSIRYSSSECKKLKIKFGVYGFCQFDIDIENDRIFSIYLYISGEQPTVNHLRSMSQPIFENFAPDHSYLRKQPFWLFAGILIWTALASIYVVGLTNFSVKKIIDGPEITVSLFIGLGILGFLMQPVIEYLRKPFPMVEFDFGSQMRKNRSSRSLFNIVTFTILVPLIFTIASLVI